VDVAPQLQTLLVEEPAKRKGGVVLGTVAELVDKLRNEAKVL
jgi:electron transfer flavoprotein beta subunit